MCLDTLQMSKYLPCHLVAIQTHITPPGRHSDTWRIFGHMLRQLETIWRLIQTLGTCFNTHLDVQTVVWTLGRFPNMCQDTAHSDTYLVSHQTSRHTSGQVSDNCNLQTTAWILGRYLIHMSGHLVDVRIPIWTYVQS